MNKSDSRASVVIDVLQSDHHVQMSEEEIAKARAHHDKRHGGENPQKNAGKTGAKTKNVPVRPR